MWTTRCLAALLGALSAAAIGAAACAARAEQPTAPRVNPEAQLQASFQERVQAYLKIHHQAAGQLPPKPAAAGGAQGEDHSVLLARAIARARPRAQQGDLFTSELRRQLRGRITAALAGADGGAIKASIMDENPGGMSVRINGRYPDNAPLSSMPPQVLAVLPKLPPELEFRFLGERLLLMDAPARLIIDYMDDALPN